MMIQIQNLANPTASRLTVVTINIPKQSVKRWAVLCGTVHQMETVLTG